MMVFYFHFLHFVLKCGNVGAFIPFGSQAQEMKPFKGERCWCETNDDGQTEEKKTKTK